MKNTKNFFIILLIVSNAILIAAYAKKQDELNATKLIAERAEEQAFAAASEARYAQAEAQNNLESAQEAIAISNSQIESLQKELKDCQR